MATCAYHAGLLYKLVVVYGCTVCVPRGMYSSLAGVVGTFLDDCNWQGRPSNNNYFGDTRTDSAEARMRVQLQRRRARRGGHDGVQRSRVPRQVPIPLPRVVRAGQSTPPCACGGYEAPSTVDCLFVSTAARLCSGLSEYYELFPYLY